MTEELSNMERDTQTLADIIMAIEFNNSIEIEYHKDALTAGKRVVNPHNLYWNKDSTKVMLDAFQLTGNSKSNKLESFKQFDTSLIRNVFILDDSFEINSKYNAKSDRYDNSILGIEFD